MTNPFEAFWSTLRTAIDNQEYQPPLHVGEVMACWTYLTALVEMLRFEEVGLNTTTDDEVKEMLNDAYKLCKSQADRLEAFLKKEGIPLPASSPPKPTSSPNHIPAGVRITDDELANGVSIKVALGIVECATGQAQSIRTDLGLMWIEFQSEMLTFSATLKSILRQRGWLKVPPFFYPPGESR
jgi:hypothetical protein